MVYNDLLCVLKGFQCERCSDGYTRYPSGSDTPTSLCIPCDCSGRSCDLLTGTCQCTGNTMGTKCESCLPFYYGKPSEGGELL